MTSLGLQVGGVGAPLALMPWELLLLGHRYFLAAFHQKAR